MKTDTRRKYFKDGDPMLFKYFTDLSWKNMTDRERRMWTPAENAEEAPIPKEVLDFTKQNQDIAEKDKEIERLRAENEKLKDPSCCKEKVEPEKVEPEKVELTEDQEKKLVQAELKRLGVYFHPNTGLVKLKAKLKDTQDATNKK